MVFSYVCLHKEEFAHKNLKMITALDLHNYFQKLSIGSQKDIKTLIKKLWDIAQLENPEMLHGYQFPAFPKIKNKQKKQVKHFQREDWDVFLATYGLGRRAVVLHSAPRERWPSGRRRTPGKCVGGKPSRGFESLSLRHFWSFYRTISDA